MKAMDYFRSSQFNGAGLRILNGGADLANNDVRVSSRWSFWDVLAFLIPLSTFLEFKMVGRLFATDVLLAFLLPAMFVLFRHDVLNKGLPRTFLFLACFWLLGQVITDLVRQTPFVDYSRGWAKIAFTMINFAAIYILLRGQNRRIVLYAAGLAIGSLLNYLITPSGYAAGHPWKFGYGLGVTWLILLLATRVDAQRIGRRFLATSIVVGIAVINVVMGFRSLGGILFLTAVFLAVHGLVGQPFGLRERLIGKRKVFLLFSVVVISGCAVIAIYGALAESGLLGHDARMKYEMQQGGAYGLIIGGRSEVLAAASAVKDSPILGHGSWAKDCRYTDFLLELKRKLGYKPGGEKDDCLIPTHSHIMGSWVEAGILGALFWLWVGSIAVKALVIVLRHNTILMPLIVFIAFLVLWDVAFSPYGAERRFVTTFYVVVLAMTLQGHLDKA